MKFLWRSRGVKCPKCNGDRNAFSPVIPTIGLLQYSSKELRNKFKCPICNGKGTVTEEKSQWVKEGNILQERRISHLLTLRNAAKRIRISIKTLSEMERGIIKPNMRISYSLIKAIKK